MIGKIYGDWTVIAKDNERKKDSYILECSCGIKKSRRMSNVKRSGNICKHRSKSEKYKGIGLFSRVYSTWINMMQRCHNPNNPRYADYGGRGITVSQDWHNFENFKRDMGEPLEPKLTIDRVDNNKGYFKENCVWSTRLENARNRRPKSKHSHPNIRITKEVESRILDLVREGKTKTEIANTIGCSRMTVINVIRRMKEKGILASDYSNRLSKDQIQQMYDRYTSRQNTLAELAQENGISLVWASILIRRIREKEKLSA